MYLKQVTADLYQVDRVYRDSLAATSIPIPLQRDFYRRVFVAAP